MFSQTIVVGNVGRDPEQRFTPSGKSVTSFSVAHTEKWTDAEGKAHEETDWFKVTAWGKLGDLCAQYLTTGRLVLVEGKIKASAWTDKEGNPRATLELNAKNVRFLGKNGESRDLDEKPVKPAAKPAAKQALPDSYEDEDIPF
jgi:single-strand DNA-binding protein